MSIDLLKSEAAVRLEQAVESLDGLNAEIVVSVDPIVLEMTRRANGLKPPTEQKAVYWVDGNRFTADEKAKDKNDPFYDNPVFKNNVIDHNHEFLVDIRGDVRAAESLLKEISLTLTALPEGFEVPGLPDSLRDSEHFNFRTTLRAIVTTAMDGLLGQSVALQFRANGLDVLPALREYLQRVARLVADHVEFIPNTLPLDEQYIEKSSTECEVRGHLMKSGYAKVLFFARDYIPPPLDQFNGWERLAENTRLRILSEYKTPLTVKALQDQQLEPPYFFKDGETFAEQVNNNPLETLKRYLRHADAAMADRTAPKNTVSGTSGKVESAKGTSRRTVREADVAKIIEHFTVLASEGAAMYSDPDPAISSLSGTVRTQVSD